MKLLVSTLVLVFIFSGCSTKKQNYRLRSKNAQQSAIIMQQRALINKLKAQLKAQNAAKRRIKRVNTTPANHTNNSSNVIPKAPKKEIKLKKVEDTNYSSNYMYPGAKKKAPTPTKVVTTPTPATKTASSDMTKAECISMIGADKFAKYTQMFGSESASLKRCKMLKAMKN